MAGAAKNIKSAKALKEGIHCERVLNNRADYTPEEVAAAEKRRVELIKLAKDTLEKSKAILPHIGFVPNPPQAKFLKMIDEGVRLRGHHSFAATWGTWSGKSAALGAIVANITGTVKSPAFQKLKLFMDWPYPKYIRIGCAPDQMNETTGAVWKALMDWLPKDGSVEFVKAGKHYPSVIKLPNGWKADIKTYDQEGSGKESQEVGLYLFDEPPKLDDWGRAAGRMKRGGVRIIFGSFIEDSGDQPALFEEILADPKLEHFFANTEENFDDHAEIIAPFGLCRGFLPAKESRRAMEDWPKHTAEARRTGRPNILSAMCFKVEPDVHIVPRDAVPKELTVKLAFDPHDVRPGVIVIGGWDKDGALWILGEWPNLTTHGMLYTQIQSDTLGLKQYSELLANLSRQWGVRLKIIDSNFADTKYANDNGSTTLRRELWKHGNHSFVNGVKDVIGAAGGVARVRELMTVHDTPMGRKSKLYIVDECRNCIEGMTRLKRLRRKDELTGKVSDELEDRFLDYPRCIMYLAMNYGGYKPSEAPQPIQEPKYGHTMGAEFERKMVGFAEKIWEQQEEEAGIPDMAIA